MKKIKEKKQKYKKIIQTLYFHGKIVGKITKNQVLRKKIKKILY